MQKIEYLERNLPEILANDLAQFKKGLKEHSSLLDCYWGELYGSLNSCRDTDGVTAEQYAYITERYLYGEGDYD